MIRIEQLDFSIGSFALRDVSLHVRPGEYFVLLGPSGSGKTLLLECLCGLNRVDGGNIRIDGQDLTHAEPRNRAVGYLPQDYALFPDRSVLQNVRYGLRTDLQSYAELPLRLASETVRRCARLVKPGRTAEGQPNGSATMSTEVGRLLDLVGVRHLAKRLPGRLSGGEKQRVALARALAVRPKVLLLDEPVSALDEQTRDRLCPELKLLQRETQTTTIHVCHNFAEMMAVADRVGVIRQGRICQVGTPQEVLERPATREVARFVQAGNLFSARAESNGRCTRWNGPAGIVLHTPKRDRLPDTDPLLMIRPENIRVESEPIEHTAEDTSLVEGVIAKLIDSGPVVQLTIDCGEGFSLLASVGKREYTERRLICGDRVFLAVAAEHIHVLES